MEWNSKNFIRGWLLWIIYLLPLKSLSMGSVINFINIRPHHHWVWPNTIIKSINIIADIKISISSPILIQFMNRINFYQCIIKKNPSWISYDVCYHWLASYWHFFSIPSFESTTSWSNPPLMHGVKMQRTCLNFISALYYIYVPVPFYRKIISSSASTIPFFPFNFIFLCYS